MEQKIFEKRCFDRRDFIKFGTCVALLPLFGLNAVSCAGPSQSVLPNWQELSESGDGLGRLIIEKIEGVALLDGGPLSMGMEVASRKTIEVKSGIVLASLPDQSIIKLSNQAVLTATLDSQKGGVIHLKRGGLLAAMRTSTRKSYLIRNSSAVIGIKGTVFYTQVLSEEDKEEGRIPQEASDYFCLCNGDIDFLTKEFDTLKSEKATYHNGFFLLSNQGEINFKKADFLLNHSDSEIIDLIKNMKGEKHRIDWIQSNRGKSRHYS